VVGRQPQAVSAATKKGETTMIEMERAIRAMRAAQRLTNEAHRAACEALATFDTIDQDRSRSSDERIAARSLKEETLIYCEHLRKTMENYPQACAPRRPDIMDHMRSELRTLIAPRPERTIRRAAQLGQRIAIGLLLAVLPLTSPAAPLTPQASATVERVIDALIQIESEGRQWVPGQNDEAGILQIKPITVREANRISGFPHFTQMDRWDVQRSRAMARTILVWHFRRGVTDPVDLACRWNRPFGEAAAEYRAKAIQALEI